jgi:hypothetical protein
MGPSTRRMIQYPIESLFKQIEDGVRYANAGM